MSSHYTNVLDSDFYDPSRMQSPRPETPEPYVRQGRRNATSGVQLLNDEGAISEKVGFLWHALKRLNKNHTYTLQMRSLA